jgi:DNA polymerase
LTPKPSPETQEAVRARIAYYRDLGVFDFYRRGAAPAALIEESVTNTATYQAPIPSAPAAEPEERMPKTSVLMPPTVEQPSALVPPRQKAAALEAIREEIGDCQRCPLAAGRHTIVFGDGDPNARLMFVGEGPGADEDAQGLPFVGRAGQLLNNMITAMGLRRDQVYIANIVKCRPPQNRVPEPQEAHTCSPFLFRQIDVIRPEVIVALGATAATYLLGGKSPLNALRGRIHQARGSKLIVTYHPAYLLRDPRQKKEAWVDLQIAMAELGLKKNEPASE